LLGEPLWLSGKAVKNEKINGTRGPGFAPHPGNLFFLKKAYWLLKKPTLRSKQK
jgi:hypothetical protein